jgi:hypothetical protein
VCVLTSDAGITATTTITTTGGITIIIIGVTNKKENFFFFLSLQNYCKFFFSILYLT